MKKGTVKIALQECKLILILYSILLVSFKIIFFRESFLGVFELVSSLILLFALPGFFISKIFFKKSSFGDKILFGTIIMLGIGGIFSYYIGLIFGNLFYYLIMLVLIYAVLIYYAYIKN